MGTVSLRLLLAGAFLLLGMALVIECAESFFGHRNAGAWVKVPATIHYADVYYKYPSATSFLARHWIATAYTYSHGTKTYKRHRFGFDVETATDPAPLEHRIRRVTSAKPTVAWVDPSDPSRSVLDRAFPTLVTWWLAMGLLLVSLGLALSMHARSAKGRARVFSVMRWTAVATSLAALLARPLLLGSMQGVTVFLVMVGAWVLVPALAAVGAWKLGTWMVGE